MKHIFLLSCLLCSNCISFSQTNHFISLGPSIGVGANFGKSSKASIGGSLDYVLKFSAIFGLKLSGGYNKFNGKYYDDYVSFLPVRAGLQAFLYEDLIFV